MVLRYLVAMITLIYTQKWKSLSHVWLFATPWTVYSGLNSPGQNTGGGSLSLLQGIFPTQESNWGLLHCRRILYQQNYQGSSACRGLTVFGDGGLQEVKVKVTQSCQTLCNPMDYTVHAILQARILEWVAFSFSRGSSKPRDWTQVSYIAGRFFTMWPTREVELE